MRGASITVTGFTRADTDEGNVSFAIRTGGRDTQYTPIHLVLSASEVAFLMDDLESVRRLIAPQPAGTERP